MDSKTKHSPHSQGPSDYGYGYNYGGYGYPGGMDPGGPQRSLGDYLLILRERIWYILVVFLVVFSSVVVYTFSQTKIYEATATVQVLRRDPLVIPGINVTDNEIRGAEDLNTLVKRFESGVIIGSVVNRISADPNELREFMRPYERAGFGGPMSPGEVIGFNRRIVPVRMSLVIGVAYRHPDPQTAARVANMFVDEFIAYNTRLRIEASLKAVDDLQVRAEQQRRRVNEIALQLQSFREQNQNVSFDRSKDITTEKLRALNAFVTQTGARLNDAQTRWQQVQERKASGEPIEDLPFIAASPIITQLRQQIATQNIILAQLRERYRERHPRMIEATNSLSQAERELTRALATAAASIEAEYQTALRNDREARADLARQESLSLENDRAAVEYDEIYREFLINENILQTLIGRMREVSMTNAMENQNVMPLDSASPPMPHQYVAPKITLNLALGFVGGLGLGFAFAIFVAFIDDRVKSSFDIESVVGLPLIGIIPQIKKMEQADKAQIVANNADRQVSEAFLTLHSSLRLKDESKNAKVILTTSSIPGEGKSFTTTNLALTFAAHGDRVVIVDCDLRKPQISKSFRLENLKGVIDVCAGSASLDDVVIKDVHPNLDVITTGGRAKNPTQILNSKNFELMVADLRKRYDRVFIDTPPLAAVSDSLLVLPLVDGSIFTIFFNKVRRKAAQHAANRLKETNVPVFGAVLNGLNLAVSGYYYAQYYDKSYKDYYVVESEPEETEAGQPASR